MTAAIALTAVATTLLLLYMRLPGYRRRRAICRPTAPGRATDGRTDQE